ncbi:MAG: YdcF family protein [Bacteroidota bacterium]
MFFFISKILSFLFNPIIWIVIPILLCYKIKNDNYKKVLYSISVFIAFIFTNSFITEEFARLWETPAVNEKTLQGKYDVAVILGGGMVSYDKTNDKLIFTKSTDRFIQAMHLYAAGKIDKIIISGGNSTIIKNGQVPEADLIKMFLVEQCIPDSCVISENKSKNTYENAIYTKEILNKQFKNKKILLLSSAYHLKRAKRCFEKIGVEVTCFPCDQISGPRHYEIEHLIIPRADNIEVWDRLIHEWVGYIMYKFSGYI